MAIGKRQTRPTLRTIGATGSIPALQKFQNMDSRWISLLVLCAGFLMIVVDSTIVNVALPSIQRDLGFSQSGLAWVVEQVARKLEAQKGFDANKLEWKLQQAIQSLPEKQRLVFNLRYYDEMPYEEMAGVLDTSVGSLKASYHHAVKKVEAYILNS